MPESLPGQLRGFSLLELLVAVGILIVLMGLALPVWRSLQEQMAVAQCRQSMRTLTTALLAYAADHNGSFPRSNHSAATSTPPQRGWTREVLPYLGEERDVPVTTYRKYLQKYFRCAADRTRESGTSYGLNVHFELQPDWDDYIGHPATWSTLSAIPRPGSTILLAEVVNTADHVMSHFWSAEALPTDLEVASTRHSGKSHYAFVDGHMALLPLDAVYDPGNGVNFWNPSLAGENF